MNTEKLYKNLGRLLSVFDHSTKRVANHSNRNPLFILYSMEVSPYCRKVIRALDQERMGMEIRDVLESDTAYQELMQGGKRDQVPCLRIRAHAQSSETEDRWLYESAEIIAYIREK